MDEWFFTMPGGTLLADRTLAVSWADRRARSAATPPDPWPPSAAAELEDDAEDDPLAVLPDRLSGGI